MRPGWEDLTTRPENPAGFATFGWSRISVALCSLCIVVAGCGHQSPGSADSNARSETSRGDRADDSALVARAQMISRQTASRTQAAEILSAADRQRFRKLVAQLPGREGVAVSAVGLGQQVHRLGSLKTGAAWSTAKVPVAMAAIEAGVARSTDLRKAITASDNAAAERLWAALGGGRRAADAATAQLRAAGDRRTKVQSVRVRPGYTPFGQTSWALIDQARFSAGMTCLSAGRRVLGLMGEVVSGQRWGLGSTGRTAQFKGGWGPDGSGRYLVRQMGVLELSNGRRIAVTAATIPSDGSFESGTRSLTLIARWLVRHVNTRAAHPPRCG